MLPLQGGFYNSVSVFRFYCMVFDSVQSLFQMTSAKTVVLNFNVQTNPAVTHCSWQTFLFEYIDSTKLASLYHRTDTELNSEHRLPRRYPRLFCGSPDLHPCLSEQTSNKFPFFAVEDLKAPRSKSINIIFLSSVV